MPLGAPFPGLRERTWRGNPALFRASACAKELLHRGVEFLAIEFRGDAHGVGQVVVAEPADIDARRR